MAAGVSIQGIEAARHAMEQVQAAAKPSSGLGAAVKATTDHLYRYARDITHVVTGGLRASHRGESNGLHGQIYIDPGATRGDGGRPADYGPGEHAKGGAHAFYSRTVDEDGRQALEAGGQAFRKFLP